MNKIVVDYVYKNYFSARSKAREDVNYVAQINGFKPFVINTRTTTEQTQANGGVLSKLVYNARKFFVLLTAILSIRRKTVVLFQYPFAPFGDFFTLFFCRCLKMKKCRLIIMTHDLVHYRETWVFDTYEIKILNTASELIVHTPKMEELFRQNGVTPPCRILWLFDYITQEIPTQKEQRTNDIAFAGALDKSIFLQDIQKIPYKQIELHLYGSQPQDDKEYPQWMKYVGRFNPENVTALHENWGLSWDGESIDSLQGVIGNYLKYISPHKVSLYIAAGLPVIISKESALADFVEKNKLGITIRSLYDMEDELRRLSDSELQAIRSSVAEMSARLRRGDMLGSIIGDR